MPALTWDNPDDRIFESGLDRGVLYLPDGSAVPWNGLTSIVESFDKDINPIYYDGMKVHDLVVLGDFSATLKAVTYPDEFVAVEGVAQVAPGMYVSDQVPQMFGLSYRNKMGNGVTGEDIGYKIHVLYNLTAVPSDKTYATLSDDPSLVEFEWTITAVPEEIRGYRPTAHLILDSREFDPLFLEDLEEVLYGTADTNPELLPMPDMMTFIESWYRVKIIDNGDGSWTAVAERDGFIFFEGGGVFTLKGVNALYLDEGTFEIHTTSNLSEVPQIRISSFPDGSWTASTDQDNLISIVGDEITIFNANAIFTDEGTYTIASDDPFYVVTVNVNLSDTDSSVEEALDQVILNRQYYKGSGNPTMFTTETFISQVVLLRDTQGRKLYRSVQEVATDLRVESIVPVEILDNHPDIVAILVNMSDYNIGADRGGEITLFDDFDIDYNQYKYLIETRCSGALTKPKSAMVIRSAATTGDAAETASAPTWDAATYTITIPADANVDYVNAETGEALADGDHVLDPGDVLTVRAVATAGHYLTNTRVDWSYMRPSGS